MTRSMMYERFYRSGSHVESKLGLSAGWVAHEGFQGGIVWNETRTIGLIFTGESFEDPALFERLRREGYAGKPDSPAHLIHLYERSGTQALQELNGPLSGLLVDLRQNKVVLFNDRYGTNRIYYYQDNQGFYFSSEAKALLRVLPQTRALDSKSVGEYLSCGSTLQNRTLFAGISLLPPASAWSFDNNGKARREVYFTAEAWESLPELGAEEYYAKLKAIWEKILPRYFSGSGKVGLSLTGGVDSRMILAWAPRARGELPCYTWGGKYRDCIDVSMARKLAEVCGQPHQTIPLDNEFLRNFPSLVAKAIFISDGAMDAPGAVDLHVQTVARTIAPVRMSGVYGGEILRRLVIFKPGASSPEWLAGDLQASAVEAATTYAQEIEGHRLSFIAFKQTPWVMTGKFAIERSQLIFRTPYFDNELVTLAYQAPRQIIESNRSSLDLIVAGNPALGAFETDRGLRSSTIPGVTHVRHAMQQFTFKAEYAYDYGMPQWLSKIDGVLAPLHLERLFLGRHKFHHFRVWYRDELSKFLKETLLDPQALRRPYLHSPSVEALVKGHVTGFQNHTSEIHKILSLEMIHRTLFEQN